MSRALISIFIANAFLVLSNSALAQAVYLGNSDANTVNVDAKTIRQKPGFTQAWVEYNDVHITQKSKSWKSLMRFRCSDDEIAIASTIVYSKSFGMGDVISSNNQSYPAYVPVVPESIGETIFKFVCAYQANEKWALEAVQGAIDAQRAADDASAVADAAASTEALELENKTFKKNKTKP